MSSDSQAMGRVGEVILRTWQSAATMKREHGPLPGDPEQRQRVFRTPTVAVRNTRTIGKRDMVLNDAMPDIAVDPETYDVRLDGELVRTEPAKELPLARRYFLF